MVYKRVGVTPSEVVGKGEIEHSITQIQQRQQMTLHTVYLLKRFVMVLDPDGLTATVLASTGTEVSTTTPNGVSTTTQMTTTPDGLATTTPLSTTTALQTSTAAATTTTQAPSPTTTQLVTTTPIPGLYSSCSALIFF